MKRCESSNIISCSKPLNLSTSYGWRAVEKRLQVHQEAFCLWRQINGALGTDFLPEIIKKCDEWWGNNSLYLEPEPRRAFLEAWVAARDLKWYQENSEQSLVTKCHHLINYAGEAITKAVELPKLNELIDTKEPNKSMQPTATALAD
ncbi:MAG: hypothetical protein U5L02_21260 [Rheinheimera sp.]|nr:hypothetical protein [Rheinheimera sp.]